MNDRLKGKVALVTGGTSGIGAGTVRRLRSEGAEVVFTGSNQVAGDALCAETGAHFRAHRVDLEQGWAPLMDDLAQRFGRLDIAFANAGTEAGDNSVEEVSLDAWNHVLGVNLTGAFLTCQSAVRLMKANPGGPKGSIIINSSMNAHRAMGNYVAYSVSKAAVVALAKSTAIHCATAGYAIRCNAILPGIVETPLIQSVISRSPDPAAARGQFEGMAPLRRMAQVEEIAGLVAFLASDEAAFISGADYAIDGAATAGMMGV